MKRHALTGCLVVITALVSGEVTPARSAPPASETSNDVLPAGVLRKGSLANQKLIKDASVAAVGKLATLGHTIDPQKYTFRAYVVALPKGEPGKRTWVERWYFLLKDKQIPVTIEFSEDGLNSANYTIHQ